MNNQSEKVLGDIARVSLREFIDEWEPANAELKEAEAEYQRIGDIIRSIRHKMRLAEKEAIKIIQRAKLDKDTLGVKGSSGNMYALKVETDYNLASVLSTEKVEASELKVSLVKM